MGIYATWIHSTTFFTSGTCTNASATSAATPRVKIVPTIYTILLKNGSFERSGEGNFKIYFFLTLSLTVKTYLQVHLITDKKIYQILKKR
jgi:hypothetical protein